MRWGGGKTASYCPNHLPCFFLDTDLSLVRTHGCPVEGHQHSSVWPQDWALAKRILNGTSQRLFGLFVFWGFFFVVWKNFFFTSFKCVHICWWACICACACRCLEAGEAVHPLCSYSRLRGTVLVLCRSTNVILASLNHQPDMVKSPLRREVNLRSDQIGL